MKLKRSRATIMKNKEKTLVMYKIDVTREF